MNSGLTLPVSLGGSSEPPSQLLVRRYDYRNKRVGARMVAIGELKGFPYEHQGRMVPADYAFVVASDGSHSVKLPQELVDGDSYMEITAA